MAFHGNGGARRHRLWNIANGWEVLTPDRAVIATRELLHPHVGEQPFTRSLDGVRLAPGLNRVIVRTHDKIHGYGGA